MDNPYYDKLKAVIDDFIATLEDGKIQSSELWTLLLAITDAVRTIVVEVIDFSDEDLAQLKEAADQLYGEYLQPLDLPGPDFVIDPILRNRVLPNLVESAFKLAKNSLKRQAAETSAETDCGTACTGEC